uniref:Putative secreted protein n=1 Tax=Anopheles darlingi TaxID=43151 RepID=A0A2M4DNS4_ANODA
MSLPRFRFALRLSATVSARLLLGSDQGVRRWRSNFRFSVPPSRHGMQRMVRVVRPAGQAGRPGVLIELG